MKIAIIDPSLFTPNYDHSLAEALSQKGQEVHFFSRSLRQNETRFSHQYHDHRIFYPASEFLLKLLPALSPLWKLLKGVEHGFGLFYVLLWVTLQRPDIIHVQWLTLPMIDGFFIKLFRRYAPVVMTVHDTKAFLGSPTSALQLVGWEKTLKNFDHYIVHIENSQKELEKRGLEKNKISILAHGRFEPDSKIHLNSEKKQKQILAFGVIKPYKGLDLLLKAFAQIPFEKRKDWMINVTGKPAMEMETLFALAKELRIDQQITWDLRYVSDEEMRELGQEVDILAFPYRAIDLSAVFIELLVFAKPIVASKVGIFAEKLTHEQSALLVEPEKPEELAQALMRLMTDPSLRQRLGQASASLNKDIPTWNEVAESTLALYQEL